MVSSKRKSKPRINRSNHQRPGGETQDRSNRIAEIRPPSKRARAETHDLLCRHIREGLSFFKLSERGFDTINQAVQAFVRDLNRLKRKLNDVHNLLMAVVIANVVERFESSLHIQAQLDRAVNDLVQELIQEISLRVSQPKSRLKTELTQGSLCRLVSVLTEDLERAIELMAEEILNALEVCVQRELIGRIEWVGKTCCRFNFYKHVVIQKHVAGERESVPLSSHWEDDRLAEAEYVRHLQGVHERQRQLHQIELMDARRYKFPPESYPLPPQVRGLLDCVAPWLRPLIRYVDGTQILASMDQKELGRKEWTAIDIERVRYRPDPAITLFDYVLTGWTDTEQREAVRLQRQKEAESKMFREAFRIR